MDVSRAVRWMGNGKWVETYRALEEFARDDETEDGKSKMEGRN